MVTEQETTQSLEDVLKEGQSSDEQEEVSEKETTEEVEVKDEKTEEALTQENFEGRVQAEADRRSDLSLNTYREKEEAHLAYIESLKSQVKGLTADKSDKKFSKAMEAVLEGDEEEGLEVDKIEARKKGLGEIKATIKDYNEKVEEVEEVAEVISKMTKKMQDNIVRGFDLNNANPTVRALNGVRFLDETVAVYKHNQDFLMAVESFLPKGDELRKQIEELVDGMTEFGDEKSKILYLKDKMQGVKVTPRKKPRTPSDGSGGLPLSGSPEDKVTRGLEKLAKGK